MLEEAAAAGNPNAAHNLRVLQERGWPGDAAAAWSTHALPEMETRPLRSPPSPEAGAALPPPVSEPELTLLTA